MTLNDYQQAASLTAVYPSAGTGRPIALLTAHSVYPKFTN